MASDATGSTRQAGLAATGTSREAGLQRILKISIVVMGVLIVVGLLTVIGRMIYLASGGRQQVSTTAGPVAPAARLPLPDGAVVRTVALSGDRLAVHFDAPGGSGIAILDLATGRALSRVELVPEPPRR